MKNPLAITKRLQLSRRRLSRKAYGPQVQITSSLSLGKAIRIVIWGCAGLIAVAGYLVQMPNKDHPYKGIESVPLPRLVSTGGDTLGLTPDTHHYERGDSLFRLSRPVIEANTPQAVISPAETVEKNHRFLPLPSLWQLQIQQTTDSEETTRALANASKYLQSGELGLARRSLMSVLSRDTHHVQALAGLALISRKVGNMDEETEYIAALRQVVPDYVLDESFSLDSEQLAP